MASEEAEPIAVVGLGCRFPGTAVSPEALSKMLYRGESAWSEVPADRLNIKSYYHPHVARQGSIPFKGAHLLRENVGAFDSSFFSIPADEAKAVDPQQRILLEVTVESLDSAGINRNALRKTETGVWIGSFVKDYEQVVLRDPDDAPMYSATGNGTAIMSNRISFFLDIHGPSMTIDTGCSASLVCLHSACQSLRDREIDVGLAGGAGLMLTPATMMPMTALNFLSPDGKSYSFDARANGYGRGEGVGIVVLKRLSDAIRDNDNIRAIIRGSRVNQDGRTAGITLPSSEAQIKNMRGVYERAGLDVDQTAYVECHGTGTPAGDWRELKAVSEALCPRRSKENPIYVGSIKTNIGHLEGCAGVAGLIKGILTIETGIIPKHLNFVAPGNPTIDFEGWKVKVPTENTPWPVEGLRRASVNSFGFGGTNAHVILDDAAHYLAQRGLSAHHNTTISDGDNQPSMDLVTTTDHDKVVRDILVPAAGRINGCSLPERDSQSQVFVFSAQEEGVLSQVVHLHGDYIRGRIGTNTDTLMEDLAYTLGCRRTNMQWRVSVAARSAEELLLKLSKLGSADFVRASEETSTRVAFVFGGQGAQWYAMGRELLGFDIFLHSIAEASSYLQGHVGCSFHLVDELLRDEACSRINDPEVSQPATTAIQVALVDLLIEHYGIMPTDVCGHSSGEIAAAYASGAISRQDAWELAYHRGKCVGVSEGPEGQPYPKGRMLAVGLSASEAQAYLDNLAKGKAVVACINSPASVTLSGDEGAILEVQARLEADGVFNRLLLVDTAYHSHHMKRCEGAYLQAISHIMPHEPSHRRIPHPHAQGRLVTLSDFTARTAPVDPRSTREPPTMYSSVTGNVIRWDELRPSYWATNMVSPVLFSDAMQQMIGRKRQKPDIVLELGPHCSLRGPVRQIAEAEKKLANRPKYISMLTRGRDAALTILEAVGQLWCHGCDVVMPWVVMRNAQLRRPRLQVDLPNYPWNHSTVHWHESHLSKSVRFQVHGRYDLIGRPTADSTPFQPRWRGFFRISENPWIQDHQVQKTIIYPAAGMIAMVLEGAKQVASGKYSAIEISEFRIQKAMIIPATKHGLEYALTFNKATSQLSPDNAQDAISLMFQFSIFSKQLDLAWQEHGSGLVNVQYRQPGSGARAEHQLQRETRQQAERHYQDYVETKKQCDELMVPSQLYETLDIIGMNYGPLFRNITSLHRRDDACVGVVRVPDTKTTMPAGFEYPHIIHPATLDSIFQTAFGMSGEAMVPSLLGKLRVLADSDVLSRSGQDLVTCTHAERRRPREASTSFVVSDASWLGGTGPQSHPLIVVEDLTFTALTSSSTEGGFLPYYRNLCSEMIWEDFDLATISPTKQDALQASDHRTEELPMLLLVPEDVSPETNRLCNELTKDSHWEIRTLSSIAEGQQLPLYCLSLLEADGQQFVWDWSEKDFAAFSTVVAAVNGIFWVTRGSQSEATNPRSALFQGLARTINSEHAKKNVLTFDISHDIQFTRPATASVARKILLLLRDAFFSPKGTVPRETEYVERNGRTVVPRLIPVRALNTLIERGTAQPEPEMQQMPFPRDRPLKLKIGEVGNPGSLYWDDDHEAHTPLPCHVVKVKVITAALTDLDSDVVYGRAGDDAIGTDMLGTVEEVGADVVNVMVGDYVIGAVRGSLKDYVRCHHELVHKVSRETFQPSHVHLATSFCVAQYALGRLQAGDTILVHAGVGSFGQAAIQLARSAGATVLASALTNNQRGMLYHYWGVPEEHIVDGRSTAFVDSLLRLTNGKGVDVIYDPTGQNRDLNEKLIAEGGCIVSFARRCQGSSVSGHDAELTNKTFSSMMVDVAKLIEHQPRRLGQALAVTCLGIVSGRFKVLEAETPKLFDYSELPAAFELMEADEQTRQIYCQRSRSKLVPILPRPPYPASRNLRPGCTYVLSGGLGGLGIEIAKMLEANGVKNIVFLSRSGATNGLAESCVSFLEKRAVKVGVYKVDICNAEALKQVYGQIQRCMPPVKGVFQCAAVVRDATFENMTYEDWRVAVRPKTVGSWNLHETLPQDMDFFIFLSSSAGVIGNRGQANYAAGNAFQDALARHISAGPGPTRAVSLDLGPMLGAGMLVDNPGTLDKLKTSGFFATRLQDFRRMVECAITGYTSEEERMPAQVAAGLGTGGLIRQNRVADPYWTRSAMFVRLGQVDNDAGPEAAGAEAADDENSIQGLLAEVADAEEAAAVLSGGLRAMLARSMNMRTEDVDASRPPNAYGVDSLVAVGVRTWVFGQCDVDVSVFEVLGENSIQELCAMIAQKRAVAAGAADD